MTNKLQNRKTEHPISMYFVLLKSIMQCVLSCSWLLRYPGIKVRSSDEQFLDRVDKFYSRLFPIIENMQFTKGGPIIAFQVSDGLVCKNTFIYLSSAKS